MSQKIDVVVVGATGAVGEAMLEILEEREFPVGELYVLASERSAGKTIRAFGKTYQVEDLATFDFSKAQVGLFSPGGAVSAEYAPVAAEAGCWVIDNTSHFRLDPQVPLVVPEVNGHVLDGYDGRIIANPNCSTIQMLVALKPLHDAVGITRINVATYQAVSGAGAKGVAELAGQTAALLNGRDYAPEQFATQIAFNAIPQIIMALRAYVKPFLSRSAFTSATASAANRKKNYFHGFDKRPPSVHVFERINESL